MVYLELDKTQMDVGCEIYSWHKEEGREEEEARGGDRPCNRMNRMIIHNAIYLKLERN